MFRLRRRHVPKKVIFMDVDGVLHSTFVQLTRDMSKAFDPQCLKIMSNVVKTTGAEVVLSSNWRLDSEGWKTVSGVMRQYKIPLVGKTPIITGYSPQENRVREIYKWMDESNFTGEWVVVDDMDLRSFSPEMWKSNFSMHFVRTVPHGLKPSDFEKMVKILQGNVLDASPAGSSSPTSIGEHSLASTTSLGDRKVDSSVAFYSSKQNVSPSKRNRQMSTSTVSLASVVQVEPGIISHASTAMRREKSTLDGFTQSSTIRQSTRQQVSQENSSHKATLKHFAKRSFSTFNFGSKAKFEIPETENFQVETIVEE